VSNERDAVPEHLHISDAAIVDGDQVPDSAGTEPAGNPPVALAPRLTLEVLPGEAADTYMDAAETRGANFKPARQFGHTYAFVRRRAPGPLYQWDPDLLIQQALAMSRLVRDNRHDARYSVRVIEGFGGDGEGRQIMAGAAWEAWYVDDGERKWLSQREAEVLAELLQKRLAMAMPSLRVGNALWFAEYAARAFDAVPTCIWTVAGLEALLNVDPYRLRRQFKERCQGLADELTIAAISEEVTDRFYMARSKGVHGALGGEDPQQFLADLATMQGLLRQALRRCIEDAEFRAIFDSDDDVAAHWPVSA
jgi:hypothetical protein